MINRSPMAYEVLARKYRPQRFSEVVGQGHVTTTLVNAIAAGRLHHAYLFAGARGTGKTTVARILAKALNCERRDGAEPCGSCASCAGITGGASLDVQEIDGASNTGVDDVRELRERIAYVPASAKHKVYIIDEVHMLSGSAFNALLKTLEEPPPHAVFIFATTEAHKIPATILSRCQRYDFKRIGAGAIAETLRGIGRAEGVRVEDDALELIAREATGSLRDAESLLDQAIAFSGGEVSSKGIEDMLGFLDRKLLMDAVRAVAGRDAAGALAVLDRLFERGADLSRFAMDILEILRHMLVLAECGEERGAVWLPREEVAELKGIIAHGPGAPELHQMFAAWYRVAEDVARSPFPKILLEVGLMRLTRMEPVRPIEDLVAKLDAALADGIAPSAGGTFAERAAPLASGTFSQRAVPASGPCPERTERAEGPRPERTERAEGPRPAFEAVSSPADAEAEGRWQEFIAWLGVERPQVASIFQHGVLVGIDDGVAKVMFDNPLYPDMLSEAPRKSQAEELLKSFFKRGLKLVVGVSRSEAAAGRHAPQPGSARGEQRKEAMREALGSEAVRQAADILNAQVYDVKVEDRK